MAQNYYDADGLFRKYGTDKTTPNIGGEYKTYGPRRMIELKMTLTDVGSSATIMSDQVFFPKNARIEQVDIVTETVAVGSGATLNIGLIATDRSTEIDYNGLIAVIPTTSMDAAGETTVTNVGSTYAGALLGTTNATVGYICADYDTAAFTAGVIIVRIYYHGV